MSCNTRPGAALPDAALLHFGGWLALYYGVASLATFLLYAIDKHAARTGIRRQPERRLLLLGLIGGWPGALLAQRRLRHKTSKPAFLKLFWCTVALHTGLFAVLALSQLRASSAA